MGTPATTLPMKQKSSTVQERDVFPLAKDYLVRASDQELRFESDPPRNFTQKCELFALVKGKIWQKAAVLLPVEIHLKKNIAVEIQKLICNQKFHHPSPMSSGLSQWKCARSIEW